MNIQSYGSLHTKWHWAWNGFVRSLKFMRWVQGQGFDEIWIMFIYTWNLMTSSELKAPFGSNLESTGSLESSNLCHSGLLSSRWFKRVWRTNYKKYRGHSLRDLTLILKKYLPRLKWRHLMYLVTMNWFKSLHPAIRHKKLTVSCPVNL